MSAEMKSKKNKPEPIPENANSGRSDDQLLIHSDEFAGWI